MSLEPWCRNDTIVSLKYNSQSVARFCCPVTVFFVSKWNQKRLFVSKKKILRPCVKIYCCINSRQVWDRGLPNFPWKWVSLSFTFLQFDLLLQESFEIRLVVFLLVFLSKKKILRPCVKIYCCINSRQVWDRGLPNFPWKWVSLSFTFLQFDLLLQESFEIRLVVFLLVFLSH